MLILLTAGLLTMAVSVAFVWYLCLKAPEGREDATGFHYTAEPETAAKPVALEPHNDHEPVAA
jgi:hypothetical protein